MTRIVPMRPMMRGLAYIVIEDDDITASARPLNYTFTLESVRCARKWRGKKFNIRTSRVIGVEAI